MQIFTTHKPKSPIFLTWKAETNEEDREVRRVEEGSNSPSQESGLNRELAGNNNQCKAISVSDSVISTGGKESESEGKDLNHKKSKRTKKNTRSRYGDVLWT
jgi:type II secretory pathway component PulC